MITGTTPPSLNTSTDQDSATVRIIDDDGKVLPEPQIYTFFVHTTPFMITI